jgi:hypothetical protein
MPGLKKSAKKVVVKSAIKKTVQSAVKSAVKKPADWRGASLEELRSLILAAAPGIVEEIKWRKPSNPAGVPVWSKNGILCTGETYKTYVKLTFMQGAALPDPTGLFNAGQGGGTRRAIDLKEDEKVDAKAFKALVKAAVAENAKKK